MNRLALLLPLFLMACASPEIRVPASVPAPTQSVRIAYPSVEVREVSLPSYAALEEIFYQDESGTLTALPDLLWADDPTRAFTLGLTRSLAALTNANVAPEPWPFDDFPAARVDVRVEDLLALPSGQMRLSGQVFIAPLDGQRRGTSELFDLTVQMQAPVTSASVAAARSQLILDLAAFIAERGLR